MKNLCLIDVTHVRYPSTSAPVLAFERFRLSISSPVQDCFDLLADYESYAISPTEEYDLDPDLAAISLRAIEEVLQRNMDRETVGTRVVA